MEIKCLIVDDEDLALNVLEKYIATIPTLKLAGRCDNAIEAITFLHTHEIDLLFLDLNMPELSGLEMLKTLQKPPKVIITTAYAEYALESYDYGVVDYLLKPIKLERFIKAVNKVVELSPKNSADTSSENTIEGKTIFVKEDQTMYGVVTNEILYIEAYGNYLKVHTKDKTFLTRETMHHFSEQLPENYFIRIHKSFIINQRKIQRISGNIVHIDEKEIPIGNTYKNELMKRIENE